MRKIHWLHVVGVCAGVWTISGCHARAPIHFWTPAILQSTVGKNVAVSKVVGPDELAGNIHQKLLATAPNDIGRQVRLVDSEQLQPKTAIRLVSATDDEPNDLAIASVARREGYDYMLRGEVLEDRRFRRRGDPPERLTLSWRLTAFGEHDSSSGKPVVVDDTFAIEQYPDLALLSDPTERMVAAAVRETHRLIAPSIDRQKVRLATSLFFIPGSLEVRRGNSAARQGDWQTAKEHWTRASEQSSLQSAAIHNLALAAVAAQDFSTAKQLARQAVRQYPTITYKRTLVWIEQKQRDYHQAFNLPDPREGWYVTSR